MDEQTKADFDRLADAMARFQELLAASGNAPTAEKMLLGRLIQLMAKGEPGVSDTTATQVGEGLDDYFAADAVN